PGGTEAGRTAAPAATPEPATLAAGESRSLGHATTGRAVVLELGDGTRLLRLEDLRTSNGPDLFVYLSATLAQGPRQAGDQGASASAAGRPPRATRPTRPPPAWTCGPSATW